MRVRPIVVCPMLALGAVLLATSVAAQEDPPTQRECLSFCMTDPGNAPPECRCGLRIVVASDGTRSNVLEAADPLMVLAAERAAEVRGMSAVDNYWVVEESSVAPIPLIRYYEKEERADGPYFRAVPRHELAREEEGPPPPDRAVPPGTDVEAMKDPETVLNAYAQALDIIGDNLEGRAPGSGGLFGRIAEGFREAADSTVAQNERDEADADLESLVDATRDLFWSRARRASLGLYQPDQPNPAQRFRLLPERSTVTFAPGEDPFIGHFDDPGQSDPMPGGAFVCQVVSVDGPVEWEYRSTVVTVEYAERWSDCQQTGDVPFGEGPSVLLKMEGFAHTEHGFQQFVIEHETDRHTAAGSMKLPQRIRQRLGGIGQAIPEVVKALRIGGVNEGPPSSERQKEVLGGVRTPR